MFQAPTIIHTKDSSRSHHDEELYPNVLVFNQSGKIRPSRITVIGVHGVGIIDGVWVSSITEAEAYFSTTNLLLEDVSATIRGSLTVYVVDGDSENVYILTDPFGSSIIYSYFAGGIRAFSSDLKSLRSSLSQLGIFVRKDPLYTAHFVATGSGGLRGSSYQAVEALSPYSFVLISETSASVVSFAGRTDALMSDLTYDEILELAACDIRSNVRTAIGHLSPTKISHLTGGVDSRLVLAALRAEDMSDQVNYFCSGRPAEPDKVVSERLGVEFGLTMTNFAGVSSRALPESIDQALLEPFLETGGIVSGPATSRMRHGDALILSGGYGEFLRSFYDKGTQFDGNYRAALTRMFGKASFGVDSKQGLLTGVAVSEGERSLRSIVQFGSSVGVPEYSALDSYYTFGRNRYFVGEITRSLSPYAARFDPLYSPAVLALGLRADGISRAANVPGFDLMNKLDHSLMKLPFDSERISGDYEILRGAVQRESFSDTTSTPRYETEYSSKPTTRSDKQIERPTEQQVSLAKELRTSPRLVAYNDSVRLGLRNILQTMDLGDLDHFIDFKAIKDISDQIPTHRVHLRQAKNLYAALLWFVSE